MARAARGLSVACGLVCLALPAAAQDRGIPPPPPPSKPKYHLGPLGITPAVALTDLGIDTNVFNEAIDGTRDFTATLAPEAQYWLKIRRVQLHARTQVGLMYFNRNATQRAINTEDTADVTIDLVRVRPYASGGFLKARQRFDAEIDSRPGRREESAEVGVNIDFTRKTALRLSANRQDITFDPDASFRGVTLRNVLDRRVERVSASLRHSLTPYTAVSITADVGQDRFKYSPLRDADSINVMPGIEFAPTALIAGYATVGYRQFDGRHPAMPGFRGVTGALDLKYTLRDSTHFQLQATRDLVYSYDVVLPYYIGTGALLRIERRVGGPWGVLARGGIQTLDYQVSESAPPEDPASLPRVDQSASYGLGTSFHFSRDVRMEFYVDHYQRRSDIPSRRFDGARISFAVTYGY